MSRALATEQLLDGDNRALVIADDRIRVTLLPDRGGDIHAVTDLRTGIDVLWKTPWGLEIRADDDAPTGSAAAWVSSYAGGWQVLLPSGGGPSRHRGVDHPYHGEACSLPWTATVATDADGAERVDLRVQLADSPLLLERNVSLAPERGEVVVAERVTGMDVAGVEYLVNARDGEPTFYDVNALSNFVANAPEVVGFDPFVDLVDLILERAEGVEVLATA